MAFMDIMALMSQGSPAQILGGQDIASELDNMLNAPPTEPSIAPTRIHRRDQLAQLNPEDFVSPPAVYAAGADSAPGMMQEPQVQDYLRQNLLQTLSGLGRDLRGVDKDNRDTDTKNWDDRVRANYLTPLVGLVPGHLKMSMEASQNMRDAIDKRDEYRRGHRTDRMDILKNLASVVRDADPNDWENVIKREEQIRKEDDLKRKTQNDLARQEIAKKGEARRGEKLKLDKKKFASWSEHLKSGDANKAAGVAEQVRSHKASEGLRRQELMQRLMIAEQNHDDRTAARLERELKQSEEMLFKYDQLEQQAAVVNETNRAKEAKSKEEPYKAQPVKAAEKPKQTPFTATVNSMDGKSRQAMLEKIRAERQRRANANVHGGIAQPGIIDLTRR